MNTQISSLAGAAAKSFRRRAKKAFWTALAFWALAAAVLALPLVWERVVAVFDQDSVENLRQVDIANTKAYAARLLNDFDAACRTKVYEKVKNTGEGIRNAYSTYDKYCGDVGTAIRAGLQRIVLNATTVGQFRRSFAEFLHSETFKKAHEDAARPLAQPGSGIAYQRAGIMAVVEDEAASRLDHAWPQPDAQRSPSPPFVLPPLAAAFPFLLGAFSFILWMRYVSLADVLDVYRTQVSTGQLHDIAGLLTGLSESGIKQVLDAFGKVFAPITPS